MVSTREKVRADGTIAYVARFRIGKRSTSETFDSAAARSRFIRNVDALGLDRAIELLDEIESAGEQVQDVPTLAEWAERCIVNLTGVGEDTRDRYRSYVRRDLGRLGKTPVDQITEDAVAAWVNGLPGAAKTIKNKHGFLSATLAKAVPRYLDANPCAKTRLPESESEPMTFLDHSEYARFLDFITPHWQPLVVAMFSTGLRWGEITALQVRDLDLDDAQLSVRRAWKRGNVLGPPKTRKSRRTIALAPETVEVLREQVGERSGEAWVFLNQKGGPVRHAAFHENVWAPAVRLANGEAAAKGKRIGRRRDAQGRVIEPAAVALGKRPRIHDARHTCASWLLASGIPINVVQNHLGHESITTTVDRYGHILPAARAAVSNAMSQALSQAHPQIEG